LSDSSIPHRSIAMTFQDFPLSEPLRRAIADLGFTTPTPVQEKVIPHVLEGRRDLIALAQTGTGKTAAFGLPLLQGMDPESREIQALILSPTRELCNQIAADFRDFSRHLPALRTVPVYGGASIEAQIREVVRGPQVLVATPGRLLDLIRRKKVRLDRVRDVVLDEADEMLDMGFQEDLEAILEAVPDDARTLLFSATMPAQVERIAGTYLENPLRIVVGTRNAGAENVRHEYCRVRAKDRYPALRRFLDATPGFYGILFCRTRLETHELASKLANDGYNADALHGDLSQQQRDRVMDRFRRRHLQILVATDVAARGLDVDDLTHVVHYSLPEDPGQYIHRSGRTGRAGKTGISLAIVNLREEGKIAFLERQLKRPFTLRPIPSGEEVCDARLADLLERVKAMEPDDGRFAPLLPRLDALLAEMPAAEILRRFSALCLGGLHDRYRDAPDLNVASALPRSRRDRPSALVAEDAAEDARSGAPRPKRAARDGEGRPPAPFARRGAARNRATQDGPATKMTVNLGRRNGFTPPDLLGMLNRALGGERVEVGRIEIGPSHTAFDVLGNPPKALFGKLPLPDFRGRRVFLRRIG
jgi:ATP-dependent RNA helicase DeaD